MNGQSKPDDKLTSEGRHKRNRRRLGLCACHGCDEKTENYRCIKHAAQHAADMQRRRGTWPLAD